MYLDALFKLVPRCRRPFPKQLAEDDDLFEEEHSALFTAGQNARVLLCHKERVLLQ